MKNNQNNVVNRDVNNNNVILCYQILLFLIKMIQKKEILKENKKKTGIYK
jgi:hypothetical protein